MGKSTAEKALSINLNRPLYGTLAEIGAGQEVARWFFKVGGAAGTIAKAMSAYDKVFSDDIYGVEPGGRYVVESRLQRMLDYEFNLLETRLTAEADKQKYFFAFADTVAAKSYKFHGDCHGWMGIKFQRDATEKPSQIVLHIRMHDQANLQQQEALGILGVNLVYGAYNHSQDMVALLQSLVDGNIENRVEINLIRCTGPAFVAIDEVDVNLQLLALGLTKAIILPHASPASIIAEEFYNRQVICHRGEFAPPLVTDLDILRSARDYYCKGVTALECSPYLISEISSPQLTTDPQRLAQVKRSVAELKSCGQHIMVTTFAHSYELTEYIGLFTQDHINLVYRAGSLIEIFEQQEFKTLTPLARVFNDSTRILIYPSSSQRVPGEFHKNPSHPLFRLSDYQPSPHKAHLFRHLVQEKYLREIDCYEDKYAAWDIAHFVEKKKNGDRDWQELLPAALRGRA